MTAQTEAPQAQAGEFGQARLRKEDERLITGQTNWTDNITLPGMLHIAFLRSPYAHARITSVDVSAARSEPGVIAAYSGADFAAEQGSLPCAWPVTPDIVIPAHPPMAVDEVRYVGEAVACVVARDRYAAADALAAIEIDYEQLPPVLDIRTALDEASPKVHEAGNKSFEWLFANGDMEAAFRDAPVVIERTYRQQRLIPAAMEPRAVVCSCVGGEFTLWSATQIPHVLRVMLALVTGIPEQNIRVIAPDVGGGFGSKLQVTAEEVLAVLIARKLGLPVKWTESRSEGNMTVHHGRDQWQRLRIAADSDGRIRGLDVDLLADMGAYLMLVTPGVPLLGAFMFPAIYKMDAYAFKCTGIFTTKMPTDAYRGAGLARGHLRHRADDGRTRRAPGRRPAGGAGAELDQARGVPVHHHRQPDLRLGQLRGGHGQGQGTVRLRRAPQGAGAATGQRRPRAARHRHLHLHRDVRPGPVPRARLARVRRGRLGAGVDQDAAHRQGGGRHRIQRARPGARDGVEPDRRRPARRAVRGHPGAARRHPGLAQGHGHLRVPVAGRGRDGPGLGLRQGDR